MSEPNSPVDESDIAFDRWASEQRDSIRYGLHHMTRLAFKAGVAWRSKPGAHSDYPRAASRVSLKKCAQCLADYRQGLGCNPSDETTSYAQIVIDSAKVQYHED